MSGRTPPPSTKGSRIAKGCVGLAKDVSPSTRVPKSLVDDSGDAGLTAERLYVLHGTREEVLEYYGRAAPAAGWRPVHDLDTGPDGRRAVFCFDADERPSVTLAFDTPERPREFYELDPGPEAADPGSHVWFSLFAESATDGSRLGCLD